MLKVSDIKIGHVVISPKNGEGIVFNKTIKTITVVFYNGNIVKLKYKNSDDYFHASDF